MENSVSLACYPPSCTSSLAIHPAPARQWLQGGPRARPWARCQLAFLGQHPPAGCLRGGEKSGPPSPTLAALCPSMTAAPGTQHLPLALSALGGTMTSAIAGLTTPH